MARDTAMVVLDTGTAGRVVTAVLVTATVADRVATAVPGTATVADRVVMVVLGTGTVGRAAMVRGAARTDRASRSGSGCLDTP
jgi:hypothetical protein